MNENDGIFRPEKCSKKIIHSLFQLANRDSRIRQLEEAVKKMELGNHVNGSSTKH